MGTPDPVTVNACELPGNSLLGVYLGSGAYTDCYVCQISTRVSQQAFVNAFYTTRIFKLERLILRWLVARPSSDVQAARLASGQIDSFAAWVVEARCENQLLLSDYRGRTRSWLMAEAPESEEGASTLLYFGSAVIPAVDPANGRRRLGPLFRALLGFHKLYSVALLRAAVARLKREALELSG